MAEASAGFKAGLQDVIAGESSICFIDGNKGILSYRGLNIHTLAPNASFEEVAHLLWFARLPKKQELDDLKRKLAEGRKNLPPQVVSFLRGLPKGTNPMDMLRTATSLLGHYDPDSADMSEEANTRKAIRLTGQMATVVAAFDRVRNGQDPLTADGDLNHAGAFLQMLTGKRPGPTAQRTMDIALILHADHRGIHQEGKAPERQCRLLFRFGLLRDGHSRRSVHAHLRGQPDQRLDGACPRAVPQQSPDPSASRVYGSSRRPTLGADRAKMSRVALALLLLCLAAMSAALYWGLRSSSF